MTHRMGTRSDCTQDKIKRGTQGKKEHIHCGDENIMQYDTPDGEPAPTAQDKIKRRNQGMKAHITGGHENIKHMTYRMENAPRLHKIK